MSIDLAGINNVNDFFTAHYLATYFEENVREATSRWKELEESAGVKNPASALRAAANRYYTALPNYEVHASEAEQMRDVADMAEIVLGALGYDGPVGASIELSDGFIASVFHEELADDGKPFMWVVLANNKEEETDVLGARVLEDQSVKGVQELDNEQLVGRLLFDSPEPPRFVVLISMFEIVLIDRNKWSEKHCMIFDLKTIFARKEDSTLKAMATLLCKHSIRPEEGELLLDKMDKRSRDNAAEVSDRLKYALRACIELLGNEVIYDWVNNKGKNLDTDPIDAGELTIECLRYMYRMLFLLFIEARPELGFAPMKSDVYAKAYSLESLREIEESVRESLDVERDSNYLDQTLDELCRRVYNGYPEDEEQYRRLEESGSTHDVFVMPPLKAHIFDESRTPLIADARLRDFVLLRVVDLMSISKPKGRRDRAERISYGTLGINQLGAVYEALLSYRGFIAEETLFEVKKRGDSLDLLDVGYFVKEAELENYDEDERVRNVDGTLRSYAKGTFVYRLAGREREKSASYYTPECLTQCLVKYALKELLQDKSADEILHLTICEPAMGSAAFLNEAISQLAEAYLDRKQQELGQEIPHDRRELELQRVKMFIADRNIYGVDLNPIAVELGEVSLWLNSISQDGFVPWFGNQLHNGNSLVGARRRGYTERALTSSAAGIRWYDNEPDRIGYETGCSKSHRVYHFLAFDPNMALYKDKAVRELEPDSMKTAADWNKKAKKAYTKDEVDTLRHLSLVVDKLWEKQIQQQRSMRAETRDSLSIFGHSEENASGKTSIRQKDAIYSKYYLSEHERNAGPFARLKFAMDYWCALWFWPIEEAEELPTREEYLMDMSLILEGTVAAAVGVKDAATRQTRITWDDESLNDPVQLQIEKMQEAYGLENEVDLDKLCSQFRRFALVRDIANRQHFFHWELEFADVFEDRGGFDLIIGNPPWVKLEWNEQAVLSDSDPRFAVKGLTAAQTKDSPWRAEVLSHADVRKTYLGEYVSMTATKTFLNATQNYHLLRGQRANLYKCFLPQAWNHLVDGGIASFVHPEDMWSESNASALRAEGDARLRVHFQFSNELKMFAGVHHHTTFSLNAYGDPQVENRFDAIFNLFHPDTIEQCYEDNDASEIPGIKNGKGEWNTVGHPARVIRIGKEELTTFGKLLGDDDWRGASVLNVHAQPLMDVLVKMSEQKRVLGDLGDRIYSSTFWNETNARVDGTLKDEVSFPPSLEESVYSGPFIGVANPLLQTTRSVYRVNSDYDPVDLEAIPEDYVTRTKYRRACSRPEFVKRMPETAWGEKFDAGYRLANREFVGCSSERTLQGAILAPGQTWVHTIFGWYVPMSESWVNTNFAFGESHCGARLTAFMAGCYASLPFDYYVRANGKGHVNYATTMSLPIPQSVLDQEIICRALMLNCLTRDYAQLWSVCWCDDFVDFQWAKKDKRLAPEKFTELTNSWEWAMPLRTDYERRQALVELDVLVSMALGLTLEQLITVYRLDFSVLQSYEDDTWYDVNGRIAFSKKSLGASKPSRQDFEAAKAAGRSIDVTFTDDTLPGGPCERTITYEAPFDCCDRVADYREAWAFFSNKHGIGADE